MATDGAGTKMIAVNSSRNVVALNLFPSSGSPNNEEFFDLVANALWPMPSATIYCEDFEGGLGGFVIDNNYNDANGLWHLTNVCESNYVDPNHTYPTSLYYGTDASCTYQIGSIAHQGVAVSPAISLAGVEAPVYLTFSYFLDTEGFPTVFDKPTVEVSNNGGAFVLVGQASTVMSQEAMTDGPLYWQHAMIDLSAYAGSDNINLRFGFQTVDGFGNSYPGFYVDDVKVLGNRQEVENPTPYHGRKAVPIESNVTWNSCVVVPNANADQEGDSDNGYPFHLSYWSLPSQRYQQFYTASEVGYSGTITQIRFRPNGVSSGHAFAAENMIVEIFLGHSASAFGAESTTFNDNIGPGYVKVYDGILTLQSDDTGPIPRDFDIVIDVDDTFVYNPATGPLLLDVRMYSSPFTTQFDAVYSSVSRRLFSLGTVSDITGILDDSGLVTMFCFENASPAPLGASGMVMEMTSEALSNDAVVSEVISGSDGSMGALPESEIAELIGPSLSSAISLAGGVNIEAGPAAGDPVDDAPLESMALAPIALTKTVTIEDTQGTSSTGGGVITMEVPVSSAVVNSTIAVIGTTPLTDSIISVLKELGQPHDYFNTIDFESVDLTGYNTVILGMDGGSPGIADMEHLGAAVEQGRKLILVGGSNWADFAQGLNDNLIEIDTANYGWQISSTPHMTVVDSSNPIAAGLPATYDFVNSSAAYYMARVTDPAAKVIAENGDGFPCLVTKAVGSGKLVYFINSPQSFYWTDPGDYEILRTVLVNSLGPVCGCWDLGHPTLAPFRTSIGNAVRGVGVEMNNTVKVSSLGIMVQLAGATDLTVTIREFNGNVTGPILAQASTPVWAGGFDFYSVPIDFTFQQGKRYNISFNVTGGWDSVSGRMEYYNFNNPTFDPGNAFDAGPFKILDGNGGFSIYGNFYLPHIQACVSSVTYDLYGSDMPDEPMELLASDMPKGFFDPEEYLESCTDFRWQVVANKCCGAEAIGPVWTFKTELVSDLAANLHIDFFDYAWFAMKWLEDTCVGPGWCDKTDFDTSGKVDANDLDILSSEWLMVCDCYEYFNNETIAALEDKMSFANVDASDGLDLWPGTFFIYKTSQGRFGKFMVENLEKNHNNRLTISWVTYHADGSVYTSGSGLVIRGTWHCDLDFGLETSTDADFWWKMITATERYLDPENGAKFKMISSP